MCNWPDRKTSKVPDTHGLQYCPNCFASVASHDSYSARHTYLVAPLNANTVGARPHSGTHHLLLPRGSSVAQALLFLLWRPRSRGPPRLFGLGGRWSGDLRGPGWIPVTSRALIVCVVGDVCIAESSDAWGSMYDDDGFTEARGRRAREHCALWHRHSLSSVATPYCEVRKDKVKSC